MNGYGFFYNIEKYAYVSYNENISNHGQRSDQRSDQRNDQRIKACIVLSFRTRKIHFENRYEYGT